MAARAICGAYRRDEAQDPETFAAALTVVLSDFPADIVRLAEDPRTGIVASFPMGLPNVGQILRWMQDKLAHREKLQRFAALPQPDFTSRLHRPPIHSGSLANVFVPKANEEYSRMVERSNTADPREFEHLQGGIRVPLGWLD